VTPEAAAYRIAKLQAELQSIAAQPVRGERERTEVADRVQQLKRDIELVQRGLFNPGMPGEFPR